MIQKKIIIIILSFILLFTPITNAIFLKNNIEDNTYDTKDIFLKDLNSNYTTLDSKYIFNITKALSNIIFTEYNETDGELAKGRAFGTKGEHKAAEILAENMSKLGLWVKKDPIKNIDELPDIANKIEINDFQLILKNNNTQDKTMIKDCFIGQSNRGYKKNPEKASGNLSYKNLKIIAINNNRISLKDIVNITKTKQDFVILAKEDAFNPYDQTSLIHKLLLKFISPYSDFTLFYNSLIRKIYIFTLFNFFKHCKGWIRYDFNNDTYNIGNVVADQIHNIFINGSIGNKILTNPDNYYIDYYINQTYKQNVESYNVIGQLNGTIKDKIVIIDCLYDGWWCQATADSAIGMAMVLAVAKYFYDNKITPKYTIRFIGFAGEEQGLRGARYYEAVSKNDEILYVLDLNQLGFKQESPKLSLDLLINDIDFMNEIWDVAKRTDYEDRPGDTNELRKIWMPRGAPSDNKPFAQAKDRPNLKTVCFLKGVDWILHHRDGDNHKKGDTIDYFDWADVNATGEIVLNITKYLTVNPKDYFSFCKFNTTDKDNDGADDTINANISIKTDQPDDLITIKATLYKNNKKPKMVNQIKIEKLICKNNDGFLFIELSVPKKYKKDWYYLNVKLYDSTNELDGEKTSDLIFLDNLS